MTVTIKDLSDQLIKRLDSIYPTPGYLGNQQMSRTMRNSVFQTLNGLNSPKHRGDKTESELFDQLRAELMMLQTMNDFSERECNEFLDIIESMEKE